MASVYWLTKGEGLLLAAQDQALCTRAVQYVYSQSSNPKCQLCGAQAETVEHLISGCSQLAGNQYLICHNNVAKYIHWVLCGKYGIQRGHSWWKHSPNRE